MGRSNLRTKNATVACVAPVAAAADLYYGRGFQSSNTALAVLYCAAGKSNPYAKALYIAARSLILT